MRFNLLSHQSRLPRVPQPQAFATERNGRLLTIGTLFPTTAQRNFGPLTSTTLRTLAYFNAEIDEPVCAYGKVVTVDHTRSVVRVFQTGARRSTLVACGNGTAAGAVSLAAGKWGETIAFRVAVKGHSLPASACVIPIGEAHHVTQEWTLSCKWSFTEVKLPDGHRAVSVRGPLNDYLLIEAAEGYDPRPVLSSMLRNDSLAARAVVLSSGRGLPRVKFYTLERAHGGAPQTGLATLAIAAINVRWIGHLLAEQAVEHNLGYEPLPEIRYLRQAIACVLPSVIVNLDRRGQEDVV